MTNSCPSRRSSVICGTIFANRRNGLSQIIHYLPMAAFGFARAINQDSWRWYLQPQVTGTLVTPFLPNLNSRGGVGSEDFDNRLVPSINYENSILRDVVPETIDTTPLLGAGTSLPAL